MRARFVLTAAAMLVAAALGACTSSVAPPLDQQRARDLTDGYRRDALAHLPAGLHYTEAVRGFEACPDGYLLSSRFDLMPPSGGTVDLGGLRRYWRSRGYRVVNETGGQDAQLLVENPADRFRLGVTQRTARYVRLAISSPCLAIAVPPVTPVLAQDLASAREGYLRYAADQLTRLAGDVAALRAAIGTDRARAAWLAAQLSWERLGAAYGSFDELGDAIDGLPEGDEFTGLHRVERGLWHGESPAALLPVVDRLAADIEQLRADLPQAAPAPADLPLRAHEVLEDALRNHLTGFTDFGAGAGLAETWAGVDATAALLDALAPLLDARRPDLRPAARAGLERLRRELLAARTTDVWPAPGSLDAVRRGRIDAALGGVLETLAAVPALLEVAGS